MRIGPKAVVGTLTGMALLAIGAMPASAANIELTSGTITARDWATGSQIAVIGLGSTGSPGSGGGCGGSSTANASASPNTISVSISTNAELINPFGDNADYFVQLSAGFSGSWTAQLGDDVIEITDGSATALISSLDDDCTPGEEICTVEAFNFTGNGVTDAVLPTLAIGDTASVSIANPGFIDTSAAGCDSGFSQLDLAIFEVDANITVV